MAREGRASNSAHNNNRRGFTLLELLVALSVAAILANLSYSAFTGIIARQQQSVTVSGIRQLLRYTRYQAVSRQQKITLCALDEREKCQKTWSRRRITVFDDINSNHQLDTGEEILQERQWPSERGQLTWRASLGRRWISFDGAGRTGQNGSFYYCPRSGDDRFAMAIVVSRSGREYVPSDSNGDGIRENASGDNLSCTPLEVTPPG